MDSKLTKLSLNPSIANDLSRKGKNKSETVVAESWDAESLSNSDSETNETTPRAHNTKSAVPDPPPPTPISPTAGSGGWDPGLASALSAARYSPAPQSSRGEETRRPEKTTAVAGRLIAGALGVKDPKKTEEQRAYDRAAKEQEIKRKNREKAAKAKETDEEEKAKNAVWDG